MTKVGAMWVHESFRTFQMRHRLETRQRSFTLWRPEDFLIIRIIVIIGDVGLRCRIQTGINSVSRKLYATQSHTVRRENRQIVKTICWD